MRKITKLARKAFLNAKPFKMSNTEVKVLVGAFGATITEMYLFGNKIARRYSHELDPHSLIAITNAGYKTATTKERLNGIIPSVNIYQKNFKWYLNDEPWNGHWTVVHDGVLI